MENFFIEENYCADLDDLISIYDLWEEKDVNELPEDWSVKAELTELKAIFQMDMNYITDMLIQGTDKWEEKFPEDSDRVFEDIKKAIIKSVDLQKLNSNLPKLYYPNGKFEIITKQDLLEYIK